MSDISRYLEDKWAVGDVFDDGTTEKKDPLGYYKSWNHIIGGDLSASQLRTGEYFLHSVEFLRNLFSSSFPNAHYKEKTIWFNAFSSEEVRHNWSRIEVDAFKTELQTEDRSKNNKRIAKLSSGETLKFRRK
ncbi:hypothetical protein L1987_00843 [Smallanthus sonchifolius]|uniref:Uncharacterized protein n=1 Tax=Smallanthus sonchifolius TaxID=185202 RepID=A0ACB9K3F8_9ASTR|nr:hypothetical protein L1987_00843 [Smallanthus sonchifolius]